MSGRPLAITKRQAKTLLKAANEEGGIVRRADGGNDDKPCKGIVKVELRATPTTTRGRG